MILFQVSLKTDILFLLRAEVFSIEMYSVRELNQWLMLIEILLFQFWRIIFFAIVREIRTGFLYFSGRSICVVSPSRQSDGDSGILQSKMVERFLVTAVQKV